MIFQRPLIPSAQVTQCFQALQFELLASSVVILYFLSLSRALLMLDVFMLWVVVAVPVVVVLVPEPEAPAFVLPKDMSDQKEGSVGVTGAVFTKKITVT